MPVHQFNISAVAFDLDGTLVNTLPDLSYAANKMLVQVGFDPVSEFEFPSYIGHGAEGLIQGLLEKSSKSSRVDKSLVEEANTIFKKEYRSCATRLSDVYHDVFETLDVLKSNRVKLFCVTNKPNEYTKAILTGLDLDKYFDVVLAGDTLERKKPDPLPLNHLCREFKLGVESLLMVGDSIVDVEAARRAGCPVFCVSYGYHGSIAIDSLGADAIIDSVRDIFPLIKIEQYTS